MHPGIYESLITESIRTKLLELNREEYIVLESPLARDRATQLLSLHLSQAIRKVENHPKLSVQAKAEFTNRLLRWLQSELTNYDPGDDLIELPGQVLQAVIRKMKFEYADSELDLDKILPRSGLTQSALFVGGGNYNLESELKREILNSNRIDLLVSFIKWTAIVLLRDALLSFTQNGGNLRVITTTYMGATDARAIQELSRLPNTVIKVSYNTRNERLHAKAYLFLRDSGLDTAYIGSSNFSRSALTDGLEWNMKVTAMEPPHIIEKFKATFDRYWDQPDFKLYDDQVHFPELEKKIRESRTGNHSASSPAFFDLRPYPFQQEILEKLRVERGVHGRFRNLVVAATGTGKTMISAFDFRSFLEKNRESRFLFAAHRIEILKQARETYRHVLRDQNFGDLLGDGNEPQDYGNLFATIPSLVNRILNGIGVPHAYDYIVIDEVHHAQAASYQKLIQFFQPKILLGLTATPERMDGKSILPDFDDHIAAEIRLPDALNKKLLCPFHYFGVSDSVNLDQVKWHRGRYDEKELNALYVGNRQRVRNIIDNLRNYCRNYQDLRALCFCAGKAHADFMAESFTNEGLRAAALSSDNAEEREIWLRKLRNKEIHYLFVVDMFNEGVDIPEVDTVLFLRPTESLTVFLQQLGRGLRLHEDKEVLTVLDFVGNARPEYPLFESKFRALIGKTNASVLTEIENDFPHLPLGCSIILEKKARKVIIQNIKKATNYHKRKLVEKIKQFRSHTDRPLNLANFLDLYHIPWEQLYSEKHSWTTLLEEAGVIDRSKKPNRNQYLRLFHSNWRATNSLSYFQYVLNLAEKSFLIQEESLSEMDRLYLTMLHYDFWNEARP